MTRHVEIDIFDVALPQRLAYSSVFISVFRSISLLNGYTYIYIVKAYYVLLYSIRL